MNKTLCNKRASPVSLLYSAEGQKHFLEMPRHSANELSKFWVL